MKRVSDSSSVEVIAVVARRRDSRERIGVPGRKYQDAIDHHFKRDTRTAFEVDRKGHGKAVDRVDLIPLTLCDELAEYEPTLTKPVSGGPSSSVWPIQSGAAQSPFTGRDRHYAPSSVPTFNVRHTPKGDSVTAHIQSLVPPVKVKTGPAAVRDSPAHNPTRGPVSTLRFASQARRERLSSGLSTVVLNTEEGVSEHPLTMVEGETTPTAMSAPMTASNPTPDSQAIERVRLARLAKAQEEAEEKAERDRREASPIKVPSPKCLPRRPSASAPTPRHGIQGSVSSSGRDLDPGRRR